MLNYLCDENMKCLCLASQTSFNVGLQLSQFPDQIFFSKQHLGNKQGNNLFHCYGVLLWSKCQLYLPVKHISKH